MSEQTDIGPASLKQQWFLESNADMIVYGGKQHGGYMVKLTKYLPGDKYGLLTIVEEGERTAQGNKRRVWCSCSCGNPNLITVVTGNLVSENTSSCGCVGIASRKTYGKSHTRVYKIHEAMLRRCYSPENWRWATNSIQGYNKRIDTNNTSGRTGVSWYQQNQGWSADIHVQNKHIRLGIFESFEAACKARSEAELKYYGWNRQ